MPTFNQLVRKGREVLEKKSTAPALQKAMNTLRKAAARPVFSPEERRVHSRSVLQTPKKPNSALRKVARVKTFQRYMKLQLIFPVSDTNCRNTRVVLIRGGRVKDLPGVRYHIIRGTLDAQGVDKRMQGTLQVRC